MIQSYEKARIDLTKEAESFLLAVLAELDDSRTISLEKRSLMKRESLKVMELQLLLHRRV